MTIRFFTRASLCDKKNGSSSKRRPHPMDLPAQGRVRRSPLSSQTLKVCILSFKQKAVLMARYAEVDIVDQMLSQEDEECQALVSLLEEGERAAETLRSGDHEEMLSNYGSDTEDYDHLLTDALFQQQQQARTSTAQAEQGPLVEDHDMDVSMG